MRKTHRVVCRAVYDSIPVLLLAVLLGDLLLFDGPPAALLLGAALHAVALALVDTDAVREQVALVALDERRAAVAECAAPSTLCLRVAHDQSHLRQLRGLDDLIQSLTISRISDNCSPLCIML